jgi:hypothetical protein
LFFLRYALSAKCSFTSVNSAFALIASLEKTQFLEVPLKSKLSKINIRTTPVLVEKQVD